VLPIDTDTEHRLIVNADDFGLSDGVNRGVETAHERGIVTSASLMVRAAAAGSAAAYAARRPRLGLGLHLDFGEWVFQGHEWQAVYEVVPSHDADAVRTEIDRQLSLFRTLTGKDPTHLDSHQHMHLEEPVRSAVVETGADLDIPVRGLSPWIEHCGSFFGQTGKGEAFPSGITVDGLVELLHAVKPGITELSCHPGLDRDLDSVYREERLQEVRTLTDPRVLSTVTGSDIRLISYGDAFAPRSASEAA